MSLRNGFKPLTAVLAKSGHTRLCRIEAMQLSQSCEHCLNCQLLALGYPISRHFLQMITFWIWTRTKMTVFDIVEKQEKSGFLPSGFLQKLSLQNQKSTFTVKFNPFSFLLLFVYRDQATAFCSSASCLCINFQHHNCVLCREIARIFDSSHSFLHFFDINLY